MRGRVVQAQHERDGDDQQCVVPCAWADLVAFCGTPEYLAPELLLGHGYTKVVDWWTLGQYGAVLRSLTLSRRLAVRDAVGSAAVLRRERQHDVRAIPSSSGAHSLRYAKILQDPLRFSDEIASDARTLLTGLLTRDPAQRLGVNGSEEIKRHPFFAKSIDWKLLLAKKIQPPFKPSVVRALALPAALTSGQESAIDTSSASFPDLLALTPADFDSEFVRASRCSLRFLRVLPSQLFRYRYAGSKLT